MRIQVVFMSMLTLPASVAAHSGPHIAIDSFNGIAHLLEQHHTQGLAGICIAAALLVVYFGARRRTPTSSSAASRSAARWFMGRASPAGTGSAG